MQIEDFRNEDTELVLFYKDKIKLSDLKISYILGCDLSFLNLNMGKLINILYPIPDQASPLLSPVTLTVFRSDYEIMINYFRAVEKGLYKLGYCRITPEGVDYQGRENANGENDSRLFNTICDSVMKIYGNIIKEKRLDSFFTKKALPSLPPSPYIPGYLVDQILLSNTK